MSENSSPSPTFSNFIFLQSTETYNPLPYSIFLACTLLLTTSHLFQPYKFTTNILRSTKIFFIYNYLFYQQTSTKGELKKKIKI